MPPLSSKNLQQDLEIIEKNIKQLEKRYLDFFDGVISHEPKELRAQTEALVQRWWGKPTPNTMLRFQLQNIVQRYKSYKEKWDRQLRTKMKLDAKEEEEQMKKDALKKTKPVVEAEEVFE